MLAPGDALPVSRAVELPGLAEECLATKRWSSCLSRCFDLGCSQCKHAKVLRAASKVLRAVLARGSITCSAADHLPSAFSAGWNDLA